MFGLSLESAKLIGLAIAALAVAAFAAVTMHKVDQAKYEALIVSYTQAQVKAVQQAKVEQATQDQLALNAAVAEAAAQQKIIRIPGPEVTKYVTDYSNCITWGLVRVLDAASLGLDPANLILAPGQSDDACAPVSASMLAVSVTGNYGTALSNAEQLNALEALVRQMVAASQR